MDSLTLPTELKQQLNKNRMAYRIYRTLSYPAKQSYAAYVIAAENIAERSKRAEHAVKMLLGQSTRMVESF